MLRKHQMCCSEKYKLTPPGLEQADISTMRSEADISTSIRKACSPDETSPKRKHVRACIVFTWDHRSGKAFWHEMRIQPLQQDEVQLFKALITMHKVLQEGHPSVIREGVRNQEWIESLGRVFPGDGLKNYGRLIREYSRYLVRKLDFHRNHAGFNGTFEYEEYVSLRTVSDPNEGYEAILDLMSLQDSLDDLQRLIFASLSHTRVSECKVSGIVPLVSESYGIYRFITSMLRAMGNTTTEGALDPLKEAYFSQHARLYDFYEDCRSIKYLATLITIPNLGVEPPSLDAIDDLPMPVKPASPEPIAYQNTSATSVNLPPKAPSPPPSVPAVPTGFGTAAPFYDFEAQRRQAEQEEQARQQMFYEQQQQQALQQQQAQEQLMASQMQQQSQGRIAELERDILALRGQYDRDQLMLEQYDHRVQALENELQALDSNARSQLAGNEEMSSALRTQLESYKEKYEKLAKLYSQLRQEHLNLLTKFKKVQQRASSAQESVEKREKLEKDLKAKNVELAGLIRERDRARLDVDRVRSSQSELVDKLEAQVRVLEDQLAASDRSHAANLTAIFDQHKRELADVTSPPPPPPSQQDSQATQQLEEELEIMQQTMDQAVAEVVRQQQSSEESVDAIIDAVLISACHRIEERIFDMDSPMQAGNQNCSPEYVGSEVERTSDLTTDFTSAFNGFLTDSPEDRDPLSLLSSVTELTSTVSDVLLNVKGVSRLCRSEKDSDTLVESAQECARQVVSFFKSILSSELEGLSEDDRADHVIDGNLEVQANLQHLTALIEKLTPKVLVGRENISELVDSEMSNAAKAIMSASEHLNALKGVRVENLDGEISDAILSLAIGVTNAIGLLIQAAVEAQNEIVNKGRGSSSRTAYYKKHNKWTEGLISAAKSVASATNVLIFTADGTLSGENSFEQLIVASNEVAASTAQLVASSRVKASYMSSTQDNLESASKTVTSACRSLVGRVKQMLTSEAELDVDYSKLSLHENKTAEMEQQVEILKLENALSQARKRLGEIRRFSYIEE